MCTCSIRKLYKQLGFAQLWLGTGAASALPNYAHSFDDAQLRCDIVENWNMLPATKKTPKKRREKGKRRKHSPSTLKNTMAQSIGNSEYVKCNRDIDVPTRIVWLCITISQLYKRKHFNSCSHLQSLPHFHSYIEL